MGYGTFRAIKPMSGDMPNFGTPTSQPRQQPVQQQYAMAGMQAPVQQPITQQFMQSGAMPMSSQAPQSQYMQQTQPQFNSVPVDKPYHGGPAPVGGGGVWNPVPINPHDPLPPRNPTPLPRNPRDPLPPTFNAQKQWNDALMGLYGSGRYDDNGNYYAFDPNNYMQQLNQLGGFEAINKNRWNSQSLQSQLMALQNQPYASTY